MPALKIAYPGVTGSFSCAAAEEAFPGAEVWGYDAFAEAAEAASSGAADYALLPVENSFAGAVLMTYALMEKLNLHIVGEHCKMVRQHLLALPGAALENIRQISSHPQAIAQCDAFLAGLKDVRLIPSANTALSAKEVAEGGDPTRAAIGSERAAEAYGLQILRRDIQTSRRNMTRFWIVCRNDTPLAAPDKATLAFTVRNETGALARVLTIFAEKGLNMCRIESRPIPDQPFAYFFSADFENVFDRNQLETARAAAADHMGKSRLLGVYPSAKIPRENHT